MFACEAAALAAATSQSRVRPDETLGRTKVNEECDSARVSVHTHRHVNNGGVCQNFLSFSFCFQ